MSDLQLSDYQHFLKILRFDVPCIHFAQSRNVAESIGRIL